MAEGMDPFREEAKRISREFLPQEGDEAMRKWRAEFEQAVRDSLLAQYQAGYDQAARDRVPGD